VYASFDDVRAFREKGGYLGFPYPPPPQQGWGNEWSGGKVLWLLVSPRSSVLIRGHQIGGANEVRFGQGVKPLLEEKISASAVTFGSTVRLRSPGCYVFQIDGKTFSNLIVFQAYLLE